LEYESKKIFITNVLFTAIIGITVYLVAKFMLIYLLPFLIATALAFALNKPSEYLSSKSKIGADLWRCFLVTIVYIGIAFFIFLTVWSILKFTQDTNGLNSLLGYFENLLKTVGNKINSLTADSPDGIKESVSLLISEFPQKITATITNFVSALAASAVKFIPAFLISSLVTVVASIYIAKDYKRLRLFLKNIIGRKKYSTLTEIKNILTQSVAKLITGYLILSFITFIITFLWMLILKNQHPILVGFLIAVVDLLPVLGAGTVLIPWAIICFVSGSTAKGILLLAAYGTITFVRNFAEPKIIGKKLNVNPLLMLITIFVGLKIGGITGMFITPITVIVILTYYKQQMQEV